MVRIGFSCITLLTLPESLFRILFIEFTAMLCSVASFQIDFRGSLSILAATRLMVAMVRFSAFGPPVQMILRSLSFFISF
jgi:hypothetical protein